MENKPEEIEILREIHRLSEAEDLKGLDTLRKYFRANANFVSMAYNRLDVKLKARVRYASKKTSV